MKRVLLVAFSSVLLLTVLVLTGGAASRKPAHVTLRPPLLNPLLRFSGCFEVAP